MFDLLAKLLSSIATFLFPVFASYKALKTSDPALLTPWLMYWVVLACCLLVESWTDWFLVWIPFYPWFRAFFLLYLILPQTQGARHLYQTQVHPFLSQNEASIDEFITNAHDRAKAAGWSYLQQAIEFTKTHVLGLPPKQPSPPSTPTSYSYTQNLIARFNLPNARPQFPGSTAGVSAATDFYSLLANAVSGVSGVSAANVVSGQSGAPGMIPAGLWGGASKDAKTRAMSESGTLIPPSVPSEERISFIAAQRERLAILMSALDSEALSLRGAAAAASPASEPRSARGSFGMNLDGEGVGSASGIERPGSAMSGLSKSRSEADFEKIDVGEGEGHSEERPGGKRTVSGGWIPWAFGGGEKVKEKTG